MKKLMAKIVVVLAMAVVGVASAETGDPRVENVQARQIPDTKNVEVTYDLVAPEGGLFTVSAVFQAPGVTPEVKTMTGDIGADVAPGLNRRFVWNAGVDWPNNVNRNFTCTVNAEEQVDGGHGGVQLWEGGPYWAECNVGASKPEDCGLYFWWGDTVGHATAGEWFRPENCPTYGKSISELQSMGYIDSTDTLSKESPSHYLWDPGYLTPEDNGPVGGNLVPAHDAATAHLGTPWRMPTAAEFDALISNCTTTWTTRNGVNGRLITGKGTYASKSIFLPAAGDGFWADAIISNIGWSGFYWSSTPLSGSANYAYYFHFMEGDFGRYGYGRHVGMSVRPVRNAAK